ncbi:hypothetical protein BH11ARM1_BH11ARM1_16870 [soil metagenome]
MKPGRFFFAYIVGVRDKVTGRRKRLFWILALVFGVPVALGLITTILGSMAQTRAEERLAHELVLAKQLGIKTERSQFARSVPDSENAAKFYGAAAKLKSTDPIRSQMKTLLSKTEDSQAKLLALQLLKPLFDAIEAGADRPHLANSESNKSLFLSPTIFSSEKDAQLLQAKATLQMESGDWTGSLKSIHRLDSIAAHLSDYETTSGLIGQLTVTNWATEALVEFANRNRGNPTVLKTELDTIKGFRSDYNLLAVANKEMVESREAIDDLKPVSVDVLWKKEMPFQEKYQLFMITRPSTRAEAAADQLTFFREEFEKWPQGTNKYAEQLALMRATHAKVDAKYGRYGVWGQALFFWSPTMEKALQSNIANRLAAQTKIEKLIALKSASK